MIGTKSRYNNCIDKLYYGTMVLVNHIHTFNNIN